MNVTGRCCVERNVSTPHYVRGVDKQPKFKDHQLLFRKEENLAKPDKWPEECGTHPKRAMDVLHKQTIVVAARKCHLLWYAIYGML